METALIAIISVCVGVSLFAITKLAVSGDKKTTQEKADAILHQATRSAHKIVVKAELQGIKELAKDKLQSVRIEHQFETELSKAIATILSKLESTNQTTVDRQQEMLAKMEKSMVSYLARSQRLLDNKFTVLFDEVNRQVQETSTAIKKKTENHVEIEIAAAHAQIEQFRNARLKILDEKFIALIEDAIQLVLEKKLNLTDHVDLIYQSLDEAKQNVIPDLIGDPEI